MIRLAAILLTASVASFFSPTAQASSSIKASGEPAVYFQLIMRMQQQGAWFASLAHINAHRQQFGDSPAIRLAEADAMRQTGQAETARRLYQQLLKTEHHAAALNGLGLMDAQDGKLEHAVEKLAKASEMSPLNTAYLGDLGYALMLMGQHQRARLPLAKATELSPNDGKTLANAAIWHLLDGNESQAETLMYSAALNETTRSHIRREADRIRIDRTKADSSVISSNAVISAPSTRPATPIPSADAAAPSSDQRGEKSAASTTSPPAFQPRARMLEHFATSSQQGSQP